MSDEDAKVENLISAHQSRMQKLEEQKAKMGINTPPEVLIEIDEIKNTIKKLQADNQEFRTANFLALTEQLKNVVEVLSNVPKRQNELIDNVDLKEHIQGLGLHEAVHNDVIFTINRLNDEAKARSLGKRILPINLFEISEHHFPDYANWLATIFDTRTLMQINDAVLYKMISLQNRQHRSWLFGDYYTLEDAGRCFTAIGDEFDSRVLRSQIQHLGWYLVGEAKRLQWTLPQSTEKKLILLEQSKDAYLESLRLIPNSFRSIRGMGKVEQSLASHTNIPKTNLKKANSLYLKTLEIVRSTTSENGNWELARHEELRAWRHWIDLTIQMMPENVEPSDIAEQIIECRDLHLRILPQISADPKWMYLEFFMAYTFLAGAMLYLVSEHKVGSTTIGRELLKDALKYRVLMIDYPILDKRLRQNLEWWGSKLLVVKNDFSMQRAAESLETLLQQGSHPENLGDVLNAIVQQLQVAPDTNMKNIFSRQ